MILEFGMRTVIGQREFRCWPGDIRRRLMALTIRDWSGMRTALQCNDALLTWVLFEDKLPVAWSLVEYDRLDKKYNIMIYVRRDRRRHGYGKQVFAKAKQWVEGRGSSYFIYPDPYNEAFFRSVGAKV
ncbi:MAG TPA: GNAT family N-acetyltransferase [Candidatus Hodarchaeales archaeon]|nr:GNAT family N-acetyltransferase [Candidatus Hodarchaeales archaeon]